MKVTRIYSDDQGESHFEDLEVELKDAGPIGLLSDVQPATGIIFRENESDYDWDFHNAPQRQYIFLLDGEIELETSDGERRIFKGGDILKVEDTTGKGHRSRHLKQAKRKSIFVTIP